MCIAFLKQTKLFNVVLIYLFSPNLKNFFFISLQILSYNFKERFTFEETSTKFGLVNLSAPHASFWNQTHSLSKDLDHIYFRLLLIFDLFKTLHGNLYALLNVITVQKFLQTFSCRF